jgi:hypothetical protein
VEFIVKCPECGGEMEYDWGSEGHGCLSGFLDYKSHPKTGGYDGYK